MLASIVPSLCHKLAPITCLTTFKSIRIGRCMPLSLPPVSVTHISVSSSVRRDICWQMWQKLTLLYSGEHCCTVEKRLVVSFCVTHICNWPYCVTATFWHSSSYVVFAKLVPIRPRCMSCKCTQMGSCQTSHLWMWPRADHEPYSWHVFINRICKRIAVTAHCRIWCTQLAGNHRE